MLEFKVECNTNWGEKVGVCGESPLGEWNITNCFVLEAASYPIWTGKIDVGNTRVEFKYAIIRPQDDGRAHLVRWEFDGQNRDADLKGLDKLTIEDLFGERPRRNSVAVLGETSHDNKAGLLEELEVDPAVRLARMKRSNSGFAFQAKYELKSGKLLGSGMSGGVCLAINRHTDSEVAVKVLSTKHLTDKQHEHTIAEVQNQLSMDHPNICRLLEVYEESERLILVMERIKGPDLFDHMCKQGRYSEQDVAICIRQIAQAVNYCHNSGVCHRDLKLENFCLADPDSAEPTIKMIDFGLSCVTSRPMTDAVGTLYYVAPEVLRGEYDESCDMWSLGVMTYVMLCGAPPFQGANDRDTARLIRRGEYRFPTARFSEQARDFVASLIKINPSDRLDSKGALKHPWLADKTENCEDYNVDAEVLKALRSFMRSNVLKRSVLSAVAPVTTIEDVAVWEEYFKAIDKDGSGTISVAELEKWLTEHKIVDEAEMKALVESLVESNDSNADIPYSTFLAACFSAKTASGAVSGEQLKEIFCSIDKNGDGFISIEEIKDSFGDAINITGLREDIEHCGCDPTKLTFPYFQWFVLSPTTGTSCEGAGIGSRIDTIRAKYADTFQAARRENAAWRVWFREQHEEFHPPPRTSSPSSSSFEKSSTAEAVHISAPELLSKVTSHTAGEVSADIRKAWVIATAEAKHDTVDDSEAREAARRENMLWRKWNMEEITKSADNGSNEQIS